MRKCSELTDLLLSGIDMYKCSICEKYYHEKELRNTNKELGIYICKIGKGCFTGKKYEINEDTVPYHSLKVRVVDDD